MEKADNNIASPDTGHHFMISNVSCQLHNNKQSRMCEKKNYSNIKKTLWTRVYADISETIRVTFIQTHNWCCWNEIDILVWRFYSMHSPEDPQSI